MLEASRLIATRGFHGATTREIAEGVGIKQPSMFNHFPSKQAILEELLVYDLIVPGQRAKQLADEPESPGVRLYRYVLWDLRWYQEMPFDLRGMHEDLVTLPGLERFQEALNEWTQAIDRILAQGLVAAQFREDALPFIASILDTLSWEFVRSSRADGKSNRPRVVVEDGADFVFRGLLTDSADLGSIRRQATAADAMVGAR